MNKSNLIDFDNDTCYKVSSPLIPAPKSTRPSLSDPENNPFDKVLRTIANKDDPFECNTNISPNNNFKNILIDNENKENIGHLVSPIQTPKKFRRMSNIAKALLVKQLPIISEMHNTSLGNISDTSLQILSDSILNSDDFSDIACNLPLPDSPDNITCDSNMNTDRKLYMNIPSVVIQDESKNITDSYSICNTFNNAFIDNLSRAHLENRLSTRTSVASKECFSPNSFNTDSLGTTDISNVLKSVSSITSKDNESDNHMNKAFIKENSENKGVEARRCLSARKPTSHLTAIAGAAKSGNLNNSFAGYNYNDRNIKLGKFMFPDNCDEDSVFLEATQLAEICRSFATPADVTADLNLYIDDENISLCSPPWEEEKIVFVDDVNEAEKSKENDGKIKSTQIASVININISDEVAVSQFESSNKAEDKCNETAMKLEEKTNEDNTDIVKNINEQANLTLVQNNVTDNTEVKNAKDLLHNLTAILNNSGTVVDQRKLGESLLNSLALALNMDTPTRNITEDIDKPIMKLQRSKSDSKVGEKGRTSLTKQENKLIVPKIKPQSAAPVKLDKNLKVRNEKEKISSKGPLKALIPLTNMAKGKRSIVPKANLLNITPTKQSPHSLFQMKKTSTPNEPKIKPPIAQSTPEVSTKQGNEINNGTPISKKHFGFSISPLFRPASTNDISNTSINNSLSPKNTSGSAPNLNKSGSNLSKQSNSSIPMIKSLPRRNSASDMSTSRNSVLNRSYENNKPARPPMQLKRSSSFQNKSVSVPVTQKTNNLDNNNTVKKYGIPGTLKSLKLAPRAKKTAAD